MAEFSFNVVILIKHADRHATTSQRIANMHDLAFFWIREILPARPLEGLWRWRPQEKVQTIADDDDGLQ